MGAKSEGPEEPEGQEGLGTRGAQPEWPIGRGLARGVQWAGSQMVQGTIGYKGLNHKLWVKDGRRETGGSGTKKAQILAPRAAPLTLVFLINV